MQKKFVKNLALLLFFNLLIKPFWVLGIEPAVQETVGNDEYGEYFALMNFSFLLNFILDLGITNFNNKNIAQNNHLLTKHFSSLFTVKMLLAVIYILLTLVFGLLVEYDARLMRLLLILGFNQALISVVLYLRSNLLGLHMFVTDSLVSILDRLIMIILCGLILWTNVFDIKIDIMVFVYTQTIGYFLTALVCFILVVGQTESLKINWNWPFTLMIIKKSFPFAILVLLMASYNRLDSVMLERLLPSEIPGDELNTGKGQAGIYAKAYRILDSANMIAFLFSVLLLPIFSKMLKLREPVDQLAKLSFSLIATPAVIVSIGCAFYSRHLMDMLYDTNVDESSAVFQVLMFCFIPISTTYIFGTLLTANGNLKQLNIMATTGLLINIVLNFILIHNYKAIGSAYSSLITQSVTALVQVLIAKYTFDFKVNYRLLITLAIFILGVIAINYISLKFTLGEGENSWFLNFIIMTASSFAWAFAIRQISLRSMYRILRYG